MKESPPNYDADPDWSKRPLTPSQLLVHDVRLEELRLERGPMLEIDERFTSSLVPMSAGVTPLASYERAATASRNPIEKAKFTKLETDYGWVRHLRLQSRQRHIYDEESSAKCRWIHCSSKFTEYLAGFLWALSDDMSTISECMRVLDHVVKQNTRFSKHGKYFSPFFRHLRPPSDENHKSNELYPMLISVPFLDWTILGNTPLLRFQVDKREGFASMRSSAHLLRSVLQYYYRLENTADREPDQVFAKHKPWTTNRELDLKVRQWYGHYPSGLNVDELWILAIDPEHIVTFSSNQTWKSRWPPLQLSSRISDVSFRGIRNHYFTSLVGQEEYTATTHIVACLSGAVGMLHRAFWPDIVLCLTDRYADHLSRLQYRLHRSASTKLVLDLVAVQEELNIVIKLTQSQISTIFDLFSLLKLTESPIEGSERSPATVPKAGSEVFDFQEFGDRFLPARSRATYRQLSSSTFANPASQLLDNLQRELADLQDLRDNTDRLVTRTIQLVNIRLEDHGKAILVFTVITIIFLPLNFVSSFFGMNVSDIRTMVQTQSLFWEVSICVTALVVATSIFFAFSGGKILEKFRLWQDARRERQLSTSTVMNQAFTSGATHTFRVFSADRISGWDVSRR